MSGIVSSFVPPMLVISGQAIAISDAEISGSIVVGQTVRVFAIATASGVWQARFVDAADNAVVPAATPELDSSLVSPPVATPEVLPPAATPEVGSGSAGDNGHGGGHDTPWNTSLAETTTPAVVTVNLRIKKPDNLCRAFVFPCFSAVGWRVR